MKNYTRYVAVLILVVAIVGIGWNHPAWAVSLPTRLQPDIAALPNSEIIINESGLYTVGGLCTLEVEYKVSKLENLAAVNVPAEISRQVPFSYPGELYLAGCHVVHYKQGEIVREVSASEGNWEVCFGDRPDENLKIYYYPDVPASGGPVWLPLTTTLKDGFACAPALFTGVYAPAGILIPRTGFENGAGGRGAENRAGTVQPPSSSVIIPQTGVYAVGGVCTVIVEYYISGLSNVVHVEENTEVSANVPFPDNEGLLYLPGCHVFHYKRGSLVDDVTTDEGRWKICFAAIPDRQTTIYFYYAKDERSPESSVWEPLETTVEDGLACAPLTNYTGVYTPTGK